MITSTSNLQVKNLQQLAKKAKARNEQDVFLVEGMKMFQEAPAEKIKKVYISKSLVQQYHYRLEDMTGKQDPHLMLLENLQDPGNLGTIMRTAEGAGVDGVILSRTSVDLYNPKTIRSTMGSIYRMPFLYVDSLEEILPELKKRGIHTYAAHLRGENCYDQEDYRSGCAFFIGNEGNGLTESLSSRADTWIRIPMHGKLESLNAAVAASILMYEVCRQRR